MLSKSTSIHSKIVDFSILSFNYSAADVEQKDQRMELLVEYEKFLFSKGFDTAKLRNT